MELGLHWEGCLGPGGTRAPVFALNIAGGPLEEMAAYLGKILPGYDPDTERPAIRLCPRALMDHVWEARQAAGYLYPRSQCADYLYWALALLRYRAGEVAV